MPISIYLYYFAEICMYSHKSAKKYRGTLSERESRIVSELSFMGKPIFSVGDIKKFTSHTNNLLSNLVKKNWILKIKNGVYMIVPLDAGELGAKSYTVHSFVIASNLVEPYYVGYWSALNYHGMTEQTPSVVYVATTKTRHAQRILDNEFRFVTIPKRKLFGISDIKIEDKKIKISDPEKTVVDCLDHPEHCGGIEEVAKSIYFSKELNKKRLVDYAISMGNTTVVKRLGYISEIMGSFDTLSMLANVKISTSSYSLLDTKSKSTTGKTNERWKLKLNVRINPDQWDR